MGRAAKAAFIAAQKAPKGFAAIREHEARLSNAREVKRPMRAPGQKQHGFAMETNISKALSVVALGSNSKACQDETPLEFVARCQQAALAGKDAAKLKPRKASMAAWERQRNAQRVRSEYGDDTKLGPAPHKGPAMKTITHKVGPTSNLTKQSHSVKARAPFTGHRDPIVAQQSAGQSFSGGAR